ncbi:hypothetical protein [Raineyella sp. LH-20]|uniref:hypothetical protein n=1 Tax=Raineyella sp. LH-20 TaxID=3081204 RepID=UPI002952BABF|nr:hypothetical protein [Raineyella sp. LH-20]WOP17213.1 hypothetical protein R0146_07895 [Raineyella sp. LH-20]
MPVSRDLRLNAYVLAADPWWLEESVRSYYGLVDRIVVSYDQDAISWTGTPLPIDDCLARLKAIDVDGKCDYRPGHFARLEHEPLDNDTHQRTIALGQASEGCDWVIQLDTDEVLQAPDEFRSCLAEAADRGAGGLEYPSRYLYARTRGGDFLEMSSRCWGTIANYPGPVAVVAGTTPRHARQADVDLFRVDFSPHNTDPRHPFDAVVHRTVPRDAGILHYYWVRSEEYMHRKARWSGHADTYSEPRRMRAWRRRMKHPLLTALSAPFQPLDNRFRITRLPADRRYWVGES